MDKRKSWFLSYLIVVFPIVLILSTLIACIYYSDKNFYENAAKTMAMVVSSSNKRISAHTIVTYEVDGVEYWMEKIPGYTNKPHGAYIEIAYDVENPRNARRAREPKLSLYISIFAVVIPGCCVIIAFLMRTPKSKKEGEKNENI